MNFFEKVEKENVKLGTTLCLGLDISRDFLKIFSSNKFINGGESSLALLELCSRKLVELAQGKVSTIKIQSAFYESFGSKGIGILEKVVAQCNASQLLVILDAKRSDIGTTMNAYLESAFECIGADALTIVPHFGEDQLVSCLPYLASGKGIYVVVLPSNPSGFALNESRSEGMLASLEAKTQNSSCWGVVLGATGVEKLSSGLKQAFLNHPLLMPGLGAQGGRPEDLKINGLPRPQDLIPVSRGLLGSPIDSFDSWSDWSNKIEERIDAWAKRLAL